MEPILGIPYARNRALEMAMVADDLIAFLDDDEVPSEQWLAELFRVCREYSADAVFGPVQPLLSRTRASSGLNEELSSNGKLHPTGTVRSIGATNNVLISTRILKQSGIRFDTTYRFSGGSDSRSFRACLPGRIPHDLGG